MSDETMSVGEPHDRLTELCAAMTATLDAKLEPGEHVKCVVFLDTEGRGGLQTHGYEDSMDAVVAVFMHLRAIFRANGKDLLFAPIRGEG